LETVLREVSKMETAAELWLKLESLYMTKSLSSRLYLKAKFLTFKMQKGQKLQNHIDDFNKLCLDLENIEVKYDDEDKALVLLHSLPKFYEAFMDIQKHGRHTDLRGCNWSIKLQGIAADFRGKNTTGDVLAVRSRAERRDLRNRANLGLNLEMAEK